MKFVLIIDCGNSAFDGDPSLEVGRILHHIADGVDVKDTDVPLYDTNGNRVGFYSFTGERD